ncbi:MAG: hypothetical protein ACRDRS_13855 [Pseudonocardiaceae bacterium]
MIGDRASVSDDHHHATPTPPEKQQANDIIELGYAALARAAQRKLAEITFGYPCIPALTLGHHCLVSRVTKSR